MSLSFSRAPARCAALLLTLATVLALPVAAQASGAATLAAGDAHSCAVRAGGGVSCWGSNESGQLGRITADDSARSPIAVAGIGGAGNLTGVSSLAAGAAHSCAVRASGAVACWGDNASLQVGDPTPGSVQTPLPVSVGGIGDAQMAAAGARHSCALRAAGGVVCWGDREHGQLGDATASDTPTATPVAVHSLSDATAITAGADHSCALRSGGSVSCWGSNQAGQLGSGTPGSGARSTVPVTVAGVSDAVAVSAGESATCALRRNRTVLCWGVLNDSEPPAAPAAVTGVNDAVWIAVGGAHRCIARASGAVACWGSGNRGQLGDGRSGAGIYAATAVTTSSVSGAAAVTAGRSHSCAVLTGGALRCWGDGASGQTGDGASPQSPTPVAVTGLSGVTVATAGAVHSCAVQSGAARCWGDGSLGQLGTGTREDAATPAAVSGLSSGVSAISAGPLHTCAVQSGAVRCWGINEFGALGNGEAGQGKRSDLPVTADGLTGATAVGTGLAHSCALRSGGSVSCWGSSVAGQVGPDGASPRPQAVTGLANVTQIAVAGLHSCARRSDGTVACWGSNDSGQLALPDTTFTRSTPTTVDGISGAVAVAAGEGHSCALLSGGSVRCWGSGEFGQLGHGQAELAYTPVTVSGLSDAVAIAAGAGHTCAARAGGSVVCWGKSFNGQLGVTPGPTPEESAELTPVAVPGLTGVTGLAAGTQHTCAIRTAGTMVCWGDGNEGQLGDGVMPAGHAPWLPVAAAVAGVNDAAVPAALPTVAPPVVDPGPGPVDPGPVDPGPVDPGPVDPGPALPTPQLPAPPSAPAPTPQPTPTPAAEPSVVAAAKVKRAAALKGLRFRVLRGKPGSAYNGVLKIGNRGGKASGKLGADGSALITLKLPKALQRKVKKGTKLTLAINVVAADGKTVKLTRTITVS